MDIRGIKYRILKYMPAYILRHGSVDIAALGRFELESHTSSIDYSQSLVYPPYFDIAFEEGNNLKSHQYVHFLSERIGIDETMISEIMHEFFAGIKQQLSQHEKVLLEGVGHLEMDEEDKLNFVSDSSYWGLGAVRELAVSFTPVPRMKEKVEEQPLTVLHQPEDIEHAGDEDAEELQDELSVEDWDDSDESFESEVPEEEQKVSPGVITSSPDLGSVDEDSSDTSPDDQITEEEPQKPSEERAKSVETRKKYRYVLPLMLLLLLVAIPLFYYLLDKEEARNGQQAFEKDVPEERLNQDPSFGESDDYQIQEEDAVAEAEQIPTIGDSGQLESGEVNVDAESDIQDDETDSDTEEIATQDQTNVVDNDQYNSELGDDNLSISSGECVIVVGAFGQGSNMRNMMDALEARGFRVYVDSTRALSRVGVYSACERVELNKNLELIRREVESDSWVLNQ